MLSVLLYIPNLIGYLRLLLLGFSWFYIDQASVFLPLYISQTLLDAADGWAARRYNQVSKFGAWLDVVIDNLGRSLLWTRISSIGFFVSSVEWITFVALNSYGSDWKKHLAASNDPIVRNIMKNGFRTPFGFFAIVLGIHTLPIVLYLIEEELFTNGWLVLLLEQTKNFCIVGRLSSLYCEIFVIGLFIRKDLLLEQTKNH